MQEPWLNATEPERVLPPIQSQRQGQRIRQQKKKKKALDPAVKSVPITARVDTWAIFGFTEGVDTGDTGDRSTFYEAIIRHSRRNVGLAGSRNTLGLVYAANDRSSIWVGGIGSFQKSDDLAQYGRMADSVNAGALFGWKYRLQPREADRLGISIHVEPFWERAVSRNVVARQSIGSDFRLIVDRALVPDTLFAAINIAYQPQMTTSIDGTTRGESAFEASGAMSKQITDTVFVGAEFRYSRSYTGYWFNQSLGWAVLAGPTLYSTIGKNGYLGIAWSAQVFGRTAGEGNRNLDLVNYERHQIRLKFGYSF